MRFPPGPAHALPKPSFWAGIPQRSADIIGTTYTPPSSNPEPERFRSTPKDLRALPAHPEPAVSWPGGFRGGAHARPKATPVPHATGRHGSGVAAGGARAAAGEATNYRVLGSPPPVQPLHVTRGRPPLGRGGLRPRSGAPRHPDAGLPLGASCE